MNNYSNKHSKFAHEKLEKNSSPKRPINEAKKLKQQNNKITK